METKMEVDSAQPHEQPAQHSRPAALSKEVDAFGGLTVGQVVGPGLGPKLPLQMSLREASATLADSGRTAAAVSDGYGNLAALFTENDVTRCYFEEAAPDHPLGEWLACGMARAPGQLLERLSVRPTETLAEVADRMVRNAVAGDCACHHVLVEEDPEVEDGRCAVLSALDMVQALCRPELMELSQLGGVREERPLTVGDVMKPKDSVFTCLPCEPIKDVLRILLMSQQNSVLVADDDGVYGLFTPRDATRAYAEGVAASVRVGDWLRGLSAGVSSRMIASDAKLAEAAARMTARNLNHLVVVQPAGVQAKGVLSSFDLALVARGAPSVPRAAAARDAGPTVGELVKMHWHLAAVCDRGSSLAEAALFLVTSGKTSAAVALGGDSPPLGLLTEMDLVRAYIDGWDRDFTVERLMRTQESSRPAILPHLFVPPTVRATEAAVLMFGAARPGQDPCHHLVVQGAGSCWEGVFSALDVARALCSLQSELEVAKTGADQLRVSMVMKPARAVPRCKPGDTLKDTLAMLREAHQCAVLVADDEGAHHGLVTPRCGLQALAEGVPHSCTIAEWLRRRGGADADAALREASPDVPLLDAAAAMTSHCLHHLVVKGPGPGPVAGVLSSLDVARGVASAHCRTPFASLGWLVACKGPHSCAIWAA